MYLLEKKIDKAMDKLFGKADSQIKTITKLAKLKQLYGEDDELNNQIDTIIIKTRKYQAIEKTCLYTDIKCTLDATGDIVFIIDDNKEKY